MIAQFTRLSVAQKYQEYDRASMKCRISDFSHPILDYDVMPNKKLTWLAKLIYYGFKKRNYIHWKPVYVASTTLYVDYAMYMNFVPVVLCTALFIKLFIHVNSCNMYIIGMWRFAVVFLHMYLWCVLCSFYCFILWLLFQKWRNKRAYIH